METNQCDQCGGESVNDLHKTTRFLSIGGQQTEEIEICDFCFGSLLGNIIQYPDQYRGQTTMARGLLECFNILQKEIKESQDKTRKMIYATKNRR